MAADRASAFVLPVLFRKPLDAARMDRARSAFAAALTHAVEEVRWYATCSIDDSFWVSDRAVALLCVNAIATEAAIIDKAMDADKARSYEERRELGEIRAEAASEVRARFWKDAGIRGDAHAILDISGGFGAAALKRMLVMLGRVPHDPLAIAVFVRASRTLVDWWTSDDKSQGAGNRNFHTEAEVCQCISEFLLRTSPEAAQHALAPLLLVVDRHSRKLQAVMQRVTTLEDANPNTKQYWLLWGRVANAVKCAKWISRLDDEHPRGCELLSAIFLTSHWKENIRHWRSLEGNEHYVHALFEAMPPTSIVLDYYVRFLYHIGERSLPAAFGRIAACLGRGVVQTMLERSNTVFMLEVLLQRHVYGRPLELKRDSAIRGAVLFILDCLVEGGSSAAFRMRDDFVTPAAQ